MYSKFIRLDLNKFRQWGKESKITALQTAFSFGVIALLVIQPPIIVPPSENAVGTAVILEFFNWYTYFGFQITNTEIIKKGNLQPQD